MKYRNILLLKVTSDEKYVNFLVTFNKICIAATKYAFVLACKPA